MTHISKLFMSIFILLTFILFGCERNSTVCPQDEGSPQPALQLADLLAAQPPITNSAAPIQVEIQGKVIEVDKVVDYPLCNDNWSGTVYVSCEAQVAEAERIGRVGELSRQQAGVDRIDVQRQAEGERRGRCQPDQRPEDEGAVLPQPFQR